MNSNDEELIHVITSDKIEMNLPKSLIKKTEFGQLLSQNQQFQKDTQPWMIPFSFSSFSSVLCDIDSTNNLNNLERINCMMYFYPSSIKDIKISHKNVYDWKYNDQTLAFHQNFDFSCKYTKPEFIVQIQSYSVTIQPIMIEKFLSFIDFNWGHIGFPTNFVRLFYSLIGDQPCDILIQWISSSLQSNDKFYSDIENFFPQDVLDKVMVEFVKSKSISWLKNLKESDYLFWVKFIHPILVKRSPNLFAMFDQKLLSEFFKIFPDLIKSFWYFSGYEEQVNLLKNHHQSIIFSSEIEHLFKASMNDFYRIIKNENEQNNVLLDHFCEIIFNYLKTKQSNCYLDVVLWLKKDSRSFIRLKVIDIICQNILKTQKVADKKFFALHLYQLINC